MTARVGILVLAVAGLAGAAQERFEVASIRPAGANGGRPSMEFTRGGGVRAANVTLKMLIQMAYDVRPEQIAGGAGWTDSELFTVAAEGPAGAEGAQPEVAKQRLQTLLGERFHLALKREATPVSGYVLTVEKKGHTMTVGGEAEAVRLRQVGRWEVRAEGVQMATFVRFLSVHLQAPVEDRTGLEGGYTFHLKWTPEIRDGQSVRSFDGLPEDSLIPAVREQLGLRLEAQKVATDRFTIERAERPSEN
jgi:uncharacterized protein (TIGR03435 family)